MSRGRVPRVLLYRGAVYVSVRAEHTAIALFGRHYGTTTGALVEELSGVTGHFLFPVKSTSRTGNSRFGTDYQSYPHLGFQTAKHIRK